MTTSVQTGPVAENLEDQLADIGDRIRAERQARGWSQSELARRAQLGTAALGNLECGRATLLSTLVLACSALDIDMTHVLSPDWRMPDRGLCLSRRQVEVLREAASGDSLVRLGQRLRMTDQAVSSHLSRIYQQLEVTHLPRSERRAAAVRVALQHGLIDAA